MGAMGFNPQSTNCSVTVLLVQCGVVVRGLVRFDVVWRGGAGPDVGLCGSEEPGMMWCGVG